MALLAGFSRQQIAAIAAAIACITAVGIGLSLTIPLLSFEMDRMGVSKGMIGANTAIAGTASILIVPFVPSLAARVGVLRLLWFSVGLVTATLIGFKALYSFAWWLPLRFLFSAGLGILFVLSEYWITAAAPPERRGLVMGIYATLLALGFAAGPLILAVVGTSGWLPYLAGTALFALATLPLLTAGELSPTVERGAKRPILSLVRTAPVATLAAMVFGAVETGGFALLPVYGLEIGFSATQAAALVSAIALGNVALQVPLGILSDRLDRRLILLVAGIAGVLGAALIPALSGNFTFLALVLFLWGGLTGALYTVGLAHLGARFTGSDLVSANAAFVLLYNIGLVAGPPVVGLSMDLAPPHGFAAALAGFCLIYSVVVVGRSARP